MKNTVFNAEFLVDILPSPKPRPRKGKHGNFYTPSTPEEKFFKFQSKVFAPREPGTGPIDLRIVFFHKIPKSYSKKMKEWAMEGYIYPCQTDADNLVKNVMDFFNGIFYKDDRQVFNLQCKKRYTGGKERTLIIIKEYHDYRKKGEPVCGSQ